jgi:histidine triad (HIT) family protein
MVGYMEDCIFCQIAAKKSPADIVYEDDKVIAFKDIHPVAPVHLLVIPKEHIKDFYQLAEKQVFAPIHAAIRKLIDENKLMENGYKVEVNGGGAQVVDHLHFHLIGPVARPL